MSQFVEKVALVTGGASGLGRAAALAFAERGARVVVSDVNEAGSAETVQMIADAAGEATFIKTDVTKPEEVQQLVARTVAEYGQLDFALNNAGIDGGRDLLGDYSDEMWQRVMEVNVSGVWYCMKAEIAQMLRQRGDGQSKGVIVNLASLAGLVGAPRLAAYSASKHAVVGLTKSAALEYVRQGIRINAVCPGFTDTPMVRKGMDKDPVFAQRLVGGVPARRLGKPEEIAAAIMYLCSDEAAFMVGHTMVLDGGIHAA